MSRILYSILLLTGVVFAASVQRASYLHDGRLLPFYSDKEYVGRGYFVESLNSTGWNELYIFTEPSASLDDQYYAAGYLEGFLTGEYIYASYRTAVRSFYMEARESGVDWHVPNAKGDTFPREHPSEVVDHVIEQWKFFESMIKAFGKSDMTVSQVGLAHKQLEGMLEGVHMKVKESRSWFKMEHLLIMNAAGDFEDLLGSRIKPRDSAPIKLQSSGSYLPVDRLMHCSALVRAIKDDQGKIADVYFSHDTWSSYFMLNRMLKQITFSPVKDDIRSTNMASTVVMPSYPAVLYSIDDFYVTSNKLAIFETTYHCFNEEQNKLIKDKALPTWLRATAAVRFSQNSKDFHRILGFHNSGTYNNGYMILDWKALNSTDYEHPLLGEVEQLPGLVRAFDWSDRLERDGWVPSLNAPLDDEMYRIAGYVDRTADGDLYFARDGSRYQIYERDVPNVHNYADFQKLMTSCRYSEEPLAGEHNTDFDPGSVILSRYDKRDQLVTDPVDNQEKVGALVYGRFHGRALMGGLDSKTTRLSEIMKFSEAYGNPGLSFDARAGPTHDFIDPTTGVEAEPFSFDMLGLDVVDGQIVHRLTKYDDVLDGSLMPRVFDFDWISFSSVGSAPSEVAWPYLGTALGCLIAVLVLAFVTLVFENVHKCVNRGPRQPLVQRSMSTVGQNVVLGDSEIDA